MQEEHVKTKVWKQPIPVTVDGLEGNPFGENIFLYLLRRARREDGYAFIGDYRIELKRGQIAIGRFTLAEAFGMKRTESLRVHRMLVKLKKANIYLNIQRHPVCSIITILNYDEWVRLEQPGEHPVNNQRTSGEHPVNTNKDRKRVRRREDNKQIDPKDMSAVPADTGKFKYTLTMLRADMTEIIGKKFIARKSGAKPSRQDTHDAKALKLRLDEGYDRQHFRDALFNIKKEKHHYESNFKWISTEFITRSDKLELYINAGKGEPKKVKTTEQPKVPEVKPEPIDPEVRVRNHVKMLLQGIKEGGTMWRVKATRLGWNPDEMAKTLDIDADLEKYVELYKSKNQNEVAQATSFLKTLP